MSFRELVSEVDRAGSIDDAGERVERAVVHIRNVLPEPRLVVHRGLVLRAHRGAESGLKWTQTDATDYDQFLGMYVCMNRSMHASMLVHISR